MRKPGMLQWEQIEGEEITRSDSLEGLLRHPLIVSGTYDEAFGTPRRGQLVVYDEATEVYKPVIAAEITAVNGAGDYDVTRWGDIEVGATVHVAEEDGAAPVAATVTAIDTDAGTLTVDFGGGVEPAAPALVLYDGQEAVAAIDGIVYESSLDTDCAVAISVEGARPETVAGGASSFVSGLVKRASGLLFFSAF